MGAVMDAGALQPAPDGLWFALRVPPPAPTDAGIYRIGVSRRSLVPWCDARAGMDAAERAVHDRRLKATGENPRDLLISFDPVPRDRWTTIERWNGYRWVPLGIDVVGVPNADGTATFLPRGTTRSTFVGNRVQTGTRAPRRG